MACVMAMCPILPLAMALGAQVHKTGSDGLKPGSHSTPTREATAPHPEMVHGFPTEAFTHYHKLMGLRWDKTIIILEIRSLN